MTRAVRALGAAVAVVTAAGLLVRRRHPDPEQTLRAYYDAWADGDADALRRLLADGYRGHAHTLAGTEERDGEQLSALVRGHADAFDRVEYEVHEPLRDGPRVAARVTMRAHHRETGRDAEIDGLVILRLEHGRVAEEWSSWDYLGLAAQLGLTVPS